MENNVPITSKELLEIHKNDPELKFIWGQIPFGSKGLIVGVAKSGKTTFTENLAISIAIGRKEFFGEKLTQEPKKVLFINLEESSKIRSMRLKKYLKSLTPEEISLFEKNYLSNPNGFPEFMSNDKDWERLEDLINKSDAEFVIIDSLSHLFEGNIENSRDCVKFTKKFRKYVMKSKKTVLIVHHNVKSNNKPLDQESIAGSRVISQEFEYGLGIANIPNGIGGKYFLPIYNKYVDVDNTLAKICDIDDNLWFENVSEENVQNLFKVSSEDGRFNDENGQKILNYLQSQYSQGSIEVNSKSLVEHFVSSNNIMSRQTLFQWLKILKNKGHIEKITHGAYSLNKKKDNNEKE